MIENEIEEEIRTSRADVSTQGLARKFDPCVPCSYDFACESLADLRTEDGREQHHVKLSDMRCAWFLEADRGAVPASWRIAPRLIDEGYAATELATKVAVYDPSGKLPKDQLSWP